ncbi:protein inturned-like [Anopheles albimanus]|uniref:Protein inturned n=1 Tax=Anopheles albimanus TaxID=7167 RepID=A0A8W7K7B0_ANOAL|nr:protein inturned-like [Anopheles albimanus]
MMNEESQVWTDDQSNESSDCSDSSCDSRTHEWSPHIANNSLFFVKFDIHCHSKPLVFDDDLFFRNEYRRLSIRKKESILSRFGHRDKSKHKLFRVSVIDSSKREQINGIQKDVIISIAPKKSVSLKEVLPLTETILGLTTSLFPDGRKLMVDKMRDYSVFAKAKLVKSKDWIKSIDTEPVTVDNFESLLEGSTKIPTIIKMSFFEMIEPDMSNSIEIKITSFMDLIQSQETLFDKEDIQTMSNNDLIFSMIYISKEYTQNDELDVKFCYPTRENNCLFSSRGSFVTLQSIFGHSFDQRSVMTNLKVKNVLYYTTYTMVDDGILLLGFNSKYSSAFAVKQKTEQVCRLLAALYHRGAKMFDKPIDQQTDLMQLCEMIRHSIKVSRHSDRFEKTFLQAHFVPLPKEIQLRIDDALGELEAMDYRNWNDDFVDLFCMMTVIGCALYYKRHLVCTHLSGDYILDVESILNNFGIFEILTVTDVKNLAFWRKFYPKQYCEEGFHEKNDAYMMLVSIGSLLMVVILEVPIDTTHNKSFSRYIEEIQDMLSYFKSAGIEQLIRIWIDSNRRPQCISSCVVNLDQLPHQQQTGVNDERPQIGRSHDEESNASSSIKNQTVREETGPEHDDDEDSDWGQSVDSSQQSSTFDITDLSCENRCKEFSELVPTQLTSGPENLLYYYVQLEVGDGYFLAPTFNNVAAMKNDIVMNLFRKTCTLIHATFENTGKFRTLLFNESSKLNSHRSLVPIKEQGMLMSVPKDQSLGERLDFWIVGRLFHNPAKELYVCYRADAPQNMVELAFRICLTCAG